MLFAFNRPATADEETQEGRIVDLSADGTGGIDHAAITANEQTPAEPTYWLGIQGQPLDSAVLRTHLQLADDVGVVVENVVKDSPAAKAGLRNHDILIGVNGEQVTGMDVLQQAVAASKGKPVELKVIRLSKEETFEVTPEVRPEHLAVDELNPQLQGLHGNMPMGELQAMLQQMQQNGLGGGMRLFGPGMVMNGQAMNAQIPGGVQVSITRENDGPATVTVRKGDETWTVKGDDKEAIAKLPDDVRPFVERLLSSQQPGAGLFQGAFGADLEDILPNGLGQFNIDLNGQAAAALGQRAAALGQRAAAVEERAQNASERMMRRMEEMEKRLEQLQHQLDQQNSPQDANAGTDPSKI
jgi:membrane-associated protease RseP (regulator of RpoE activity)